MLASHEFAGRFGAMVAVQQPGQVILAVGRIAPSGTVSWRGSDTVPPHHALAAKDSRRPVRHQRRAAAGL
jgi:hypothetical protein